MTTPFDSNSKPENSTPQENFSIRTMQDDLLKIQTTGKIESTPLENAQTQTPRQELSTQQKTSLAVNTDESEKYNPFSTVTTNYPIQSTPVSTLEQTPQANVSTTSDTIIPKIIWALVIILTLSIIALGGYYFWTTKKATTITTAIPEPTPVITEEVRIEEATETREETPPPTITPPVEKYSTTKPNYLVLDTNNTNTEPIKETISKISDELKNSPSQSLYEFIPVDNNNAPIAFPIFTIAAKLNLSSKVLSDLGTNFSLFLYNDNGEVRSALASTISKKETLAADMAIQEKTFLQDVDFLFLRMTPDKTTAQFGSSTYKDVAVRYINASQQKNLSIDYTITDSQLVIGTSKNTLRVVIDKMLATKTIK